MMPGMDKSFFMRWSPNSLPLGFSVLLFLVSFAADPGANIQPTGSISIYKRLTAQSRNRLAPRNRSHFSATLETHWRICLK
jgi:hypothetical protein